jgi:hypothetical protein
MLTVNEIIDTIENYTVFGYDQFVSLRTGDTFLADCRLNLFRHPNGRWAVVFERLVFDVADCELLLQLFYYGNCITNYEAGHEVLLMTDDAFKGTTSGWWLKEDAKYWKVINKRLPLSHDLSDYMMAGIQPEHSRRFSLVEAMRQLVCAHPQTFRATAKELYQYLPKDMERVLVLDNWYHKSYQLDYVLQLDTHGVLSLAQDFRSVLDTTGHSLETKKSLLNVLINDMARKQNAPGSYETWPMLAAVMVTGDPGYYKPEHSPNTHWLYWPNRYEEFKRPGYA